MKFGIDEFINERKFMNVSEHTIRRYEQQFNQFNNYMTENEVINVEEVTSNHVKSFLMNFQNDAPSTRNSRIRTLKSFFNFMFSCEVIIEAKNPMKKISYVREDVQIEVFSDEQIRQMLAYYRRLKGRDKSFFAYRDHTIIIFLLATGVRLGEMCNLKWSDVDLDTGTIVVFGKKRQSRSIPITDKLTKELLAYKHYVDNHFRFEPQYVFTNSLNHKMTTSAGKQIFQRLKAIMNFKNCRLSAHTFRHSFAHRCLMAGMDVFTLQKLLGHSKLDMTMRYVALWGTALRDQAEKYSPLNSLDI
ncbi:tyrosine-type recombinase/integrase [Bacillus horti]|uniref:Integrase/recombinase XerD n=1 Tax=Caldalkalibacillus horti TaxID=77523 RepID=A0ABT9W4M0_9BACI|nr:tyrosine-type recombinase/integrase [Bacillus horti]MDQ0168201.1 integrase/recombinase XerD [Bacillus horti]